MRGGDEDEEGFGFKEEGGFAIGVLRRFMAARLVM